MLSVNKLQNILNEMHHNFITPPDFIVTVLIVDADAADIAAVAEQCRNSEIPYNVYLYHTDMNDLDWLQQVMLQSNVVLLAAESTLPVTWNYRFGPNEEFKTPVDYFKNIQKI